MAASKSTAKKKAVGARAPSRGAKVAPKKRVSSAGAGAGDVGFAAKLAIWEALVDEAITATTAGAVRRIRARAEALDHLPIDLFAEDDADEDALTRAHTAMNEKIAARSQGLPAVSDMAWELSSLRDLINVS